MNDLGYILSTDHLDVGYESRTVIRNVDIQALKGQTICLLGPNGAGKSTILRTLTGMLSPVNGCVYIEKNDVRRMKSADRAKKLAVVLTEKLNLNMTSAYEVAAMGRTPYTGFFGRLTDEDKEIIEECLRTVGAWELRDRDYRSLSDGEKQKVMIARALAQRPELIVLDEPTSHLDIKHKIEVVRILNKLAIETGLTVILALHDIDIAVKFCQIVLLVKDGKIVAQGRPEDIVRRDTVDELYGIEEGAFYDSILGSVEICNEANPEIFVMAGAGCGIPVYRLVSRLGFGIATGILAQNDIDYVVASAMKLTAVSTRSFQPIREEEIRQAQQCMERCRFVIDTGFPVGQENRENAKLLRQAVGRGKRIFSLRDPKDSAEICGQNANIVHVSSMAELSGRLQGELA